MDPLSWWQLAGQSAGFMGPSASVASLSQNPEGVRMFMSRGLSLWGRAPWRRPSMVGISILGGARAGADGLSASRAPCTFITSMGVGFWAPR